jgi:hypothetical protein
MDSLGLCVFTLLVKLFCEVVHIRKRVWVIHRLVELQRLPVHRLGLCVLALLS